MLFCGSAPFLSTFALLAGCGKKDEDAAESAVAQGRETAASDDESNPFERAMAEREQKRAERKAAREAAKEAEKLNPKPDRAARGHREDGRERR